MDEDTRTDLRSQKGALRAPGAIPQIPRLDQIDQHRVSKITQTWTDLLCYRDLERGPWCDAPD